MYICRKDLKMKNNSIYKFLIIVVSVSCMFSCKSREYIAYYQGIESLSNKESQNTFESTIQPDDLLMIVVSALDPESAAPFNLETTIVPTAMGQSQLAQRQQQLYLVDKNGMVEFPVLGQLSFGGKTKTEVTAFLKEKLALYVKTPIVNIRIMNYKITVQGEVAKPGSYNISSERVTLPEALSLAGDLTINGKRENLILIREVNGKKSYNRIDITKPDFINSPFYYLSQNDLIYVEPNQAKSNSSTVFNQNIPVMISAVSLLSSIIFSIILINKS